MGQNARTRDTFSTLALAVSLLWLLDFRLLPVAHAQTKPGPLSAPLATVSVIEVSPKALPLYTEYTGTTDALDTAEIRARVDGYIEQQLFQGGQVVKAGERLYLLDQRTFSVEVQKAKAAVAKAEADLQLLVPYEQTIQTACREVSDALIGYDKTWEQRAQQALLVGAQQDQTVLATKRFLGGLDTYLQVLDAEHDLFDAALTLVRLQRDELLNIVGLYRALDSGWESVVAPEKVASLSRLDK